MSPVEAPERNNQIFLRIIKPTFLKAEAKDSAQLSPEDCLAISPTQLPILDFTPIETGIGDHVKIVLRTPLFGDTHIAYAFHEHVQIWLGAEELVWPQLPKLVEVNQGPTINVPGIGTVNLYAPVIQDVSRFQLNSLDFGSQHADRMLQRVEADLDPKGYFSWAELTHDGTRVPEESWKIFNMLMLAHHLNKARISLGKALGMTSGYRSPEINKSIGGAKYSQHMYGGAADLWSNGETGLSLLKYFGEQWYHDQIGGVGIYPHLRNIIHVDVRCLALLPPNMAHLNLNRQTKWGWQ